VVLSGEGKKLQSNKLTSFEVYVRRYNKVGRVNNETDDDASSLITQDPSPRFSPLLDKSPSNVIPNFFRVTDRGDDNEEKALVEDD